MFYLNLKLKILKKKIIKSQSLKKNKFYLNHKVSFKPQSLKFHLNQLFT
jgi:hypothetical protein